MYHHQPVHAPPPPYHEHPASREGAAGDHGAHGNEQDGACGGALEENNDMSPPGRPSPGASGENEDQGEAQVVPPSGQEVPPHVVHAPVHGYPPHYHPQYPPQHHYYPPPPYGEQPPPPPGSYYHPPPDAWNTPYVAYSPPSEGDHPHGAPPPHYYPYGPTPYHPYGLPPYQEMPPVGHDPRGPSPYPSHPAPPARPPPSRETKPPAAAPAARGGASKSVRRKKKMYSDFVGVTYNKTHAKYQACITHYRKQHYLGRYKLAVDAALAYDESARLLKGPNWKVNFATREAYEEAKAKELDGIGKRGGQIDVAGSLAAVAMKVEEIASLSNGNAARRATSAAEYHGHVDSGVPRHGPNLTLLNGSHERLAYVTDKPLAHVPPSLAKTVVAAPDMTKVTPSPSLHVPLHEQLAPAPAPSATKLKSVDSPLPETPNPTRHAMGVEKGTPSSVIRPTALTYRKGRGPSDLGGETATAPMANDGEATMPQPPNPSPAAPSHGKSPARDKATGTPKRAPPVIQNGTLAAASALMDLFGNDTPEKEKEPTT